MPEVDDGPLIHLVKCRKDYYMNCTNLFCYFIFYILMSKTRKVLCLKMLIFLHHFVSFFDVFY